MAEEVILAKDLFALPSQLKLIPEQAQKWHHPEIASFRRGGNALLRGFEFAPEDAPEVLSIRPRTDYLILHLSISKEPEI